MRSLITCFVLAAAPLALLGTVPSAVEAQRPSPIAVRYARPNALYQLRNYRYQPFYAYRSQLMYPIDLTYGTYPTYGSYPEYGFYPTYGPYLAYGPDLIYGSDLTYGADLMYGSDLTYQGYDWFQPPGKTYEWPSNYEPSLPSESAGATSTVKVGLYDNYFEPANISVPAGTTVVWTNLGEHSHTITADKERWDSGMLGPGESSSCTFNLPGTYRYHCAIHGQDMRAVVVVK